MVDLFRPFRYQFTNVSVFFLFIILNITLNSCKSRPESSVVHSGAEPAVIVGNGKAEHHVRLLPYWVPSAQFAGYYVGIEKGIFQRHGINLEILPFNPLVTVSTVLTDHKTDFVLLWLVNAMYVRDKGIDIVNIAQLSSRSSLMLITKKSSGISKIEDMDGKRAGIWFGFELMPQALFNKYHLGVQIVPIGSTNNLFLQGGVDILNASWFDEYHSIINSGVNEDELNKFFLADYGLNFLEDGIYCLGEKAKNDPQLCREFVEAVLESWNYAFNNQEEAIDIVVKYAKRMNQPVNRPHQRWMLGAYKKLYIPAGRNQINTELGRKEYEEIQRIMLEGRFVVNATPFDSIYKPCLKLSGSR